MTTRADALPRRPAPWSLLLLALPLLGLALLISRPELDLEWKHQPSHFWLVLTVAGVNVALAYFTNEAAMRRGDARLVLISLAFGTSAGFLGLHALATPGVLLPASNLGFVIATPVGLTIAAGLAAGSALPLAGPRGGWVLRRARALRIALGVLLIVWGVASLLRLPPFMAEAPPAEVAPPLRVGAAVAVGLYAFAAWHFTRLFLARQRPLLLAIVVALVLLAEAMITVAFSRDWHLSWWEWHVLMAVAFGTVAYGARIEYRREGSLTGAFGGLYLSGTLERLHRWHADALSDLAAARAKGEPTEPVLRRLRVDGATTEELALLERASGELERVDQLFRPYLPQQFAEQARTDPAHAQLGSGEEREVTVLFADLSGFTSYSERHAPTEVVELLNAIWTAVVPIVTAEDGLIESFAGDGLLVIFNAVGNQPDHAARAVRTATRIRDAVDAVGIGSGTTVPRFHIGINSGPAFVGSVGAAGRRTFSAIGDTTNLGSRLLGAAGAGEIVVGESTWARLIDPRGDALDPLRVKGKHDPVLAWRLSSA
ncbi:MAG TPA: adenylate/guanylate cyclase domain-containing protein [Candidatus Limnocylindria bacterium]|nr:adenylate/guanylate cyclase domain-containing protein [Candidatus Limnocylindria bacterium]